MPIKVDEDIVLCSPLKMSLEFNQFYKEKWQEKFRSVYWLMDSSIPDGVIAYASMIEGKIHFRAFPESINEIFTIAHEMMHIVRFQDDDVLIINPVNQLDVLHNSLAILIGSMFEDPLVDRFLQEKYHFSWCVPCQNSINNDIATAVVESGDPNSWLRRGINLADYLLRTDLLEDRSTLDRWSHHMTWYEIQYPHSYEIGNEIALIAKETGLDSIEQRTGVFNELVDKYNLRNAVFI